MRTPTTSTRPTTKTHGQRKYRAVDRVLMRSVGVVLLFITLSTFLAAMSAPSEGWNAQQAWFAVFVLSLGFTVSIASLITNTGVRQ